MENFDVIIIGAGPSGLECANTLKNSNLSILLIEKNNIIGPKVCAGGINLLETIVDIPDKFVNIFSKEIIFVGKCKYEVNLQNTRKVFERLDLGQYQLSKINNSSKIKILTGVLVTKINNDFITTNAGDFGFKYLVGADGSNSQVRRYLGLKTKFCVGMYYNVPNTKMEFVGYYDPKTIGSGYIWEFPHKEYNNVGIYFNIKKLSTVKAKGYLEEYIKDRKYDYSKSKLEMLPINYFYNGHNFGNMFLIGDAGGFTSELHGGGISNGMMSGREVAKKILDPTYNYIELLQILKNKKSEERLLRIFEKLGVLQDPLMKFVVKLFQSPWIQKHTKLV